jgi:P4 family phage/plasmid primase-like protien
MSSINFAYYERHGAHLLLLPPDSKIPDRAWDDITTNSPAIWSKHTGNLAIHCGKSGLIVIDLDVKVKQTDGSYLCNEATSDAAWSKAEELFAELGIPDAVKEAPHVQTKSGGLHWYFKAPADVELSKTKVKGCIDIQAGNAIAVIHTAFDPMPEPYAAPEALVALVTKAAPADGSVTKVAANSYNRDDVAELVRRLTANGAVTDHGEWLKLGQALFDAGLADLWSIADLDADAQAEREREVRGWERKPSHCANPVTLSTFFDIARKGDYGVQVRKTVSGMFGNVDLAALPKPDLLAALPPSAPEAAVPAGQIMIEGAAIDASSDDGLAYQFVTAACAELRYCADLDAWFRWDGARWLKRDESVAFDLIRRYLRGISNMVTNTALKKALGSVKQTRAVKTFVSMDPRMQVYVTDFDADPWLLGTPGGVVDLKTGTLRDAKPEDFISKSTSVAPGGDCPTWKAALLRSFGGDKSMVDYMQRVLGSTLSGAILEQAMFFDYGDGANGKSLKNDTASAILADYAQTVKAELFTARRSDSTTDYHKVKLAGCRLAVANELERGATWNESLVKNLTGADTIVARDPGGKPFSFKPQFTLIMSGNHKPALQSVERNMRRRVRLIKFASIPANEIDPDLPRKLKGELSGILQWMVEGCLEWQRRGFDDPESVVRETDAYFAEQDSFEMWVDDCCIRDAEAWTPRSVLTKSWLEWNGRDGDTARKQFVTDLRTKKLEETKRRGIWGVKGLQLRASVVPPAPMRAPEQEPESNVVAFPPLPPITKRA